MPPAAAEDVVARLTTLPGVPCPCGTARRAFAEASGGRATLHLVEVKRDAAPHFHRQLTETYYVLEGSGFIELDGSRRPLAAGDAVVIRPGVVHRAIPGATELRILNFVTPAFDAADEYVVGEAAD